MTATVLYAAYGSNLHPVRLGARVPSAVLLGKSSVSGRSLRFHKRGRDGSGKCNIVQADAEVFVAVYEMASRHIPRLHRFEGAGMGYEVETLRVPDFGECMTYVASLEHIDDELTAWSWYKELVLAGCRYLGFPNQYIAEITGLTSRRDPDRARHDEHMQIVEDAHRAPRLQYMLRGS